MQQTSGQKEILLMDNKGGLQMKKFFKELLNKRLNNEKGLTLIELLAVIVILAIIAAIAVPAIGNIIDNSRLNAVKADAVNVINAANLFDTENSPTTAVTVQDLIDADFLDSPGSIPTNATISLTNPRELSNATVVDAVGNFDVTFTGATIDEINNFETRGGDMTGDITIGTTTVTTTP